MNDHHNALPAGYRLGEYEIQAVLGSGGFGITYKARDCKLSKLVAIKEYLPSDFAVRDDWMTVKPKDSASKDNYVWGLERFLDEARALARFDHPHINKVHRFIEANGTAYLVLEYIDGDMLSDLLRDKGHFNESGIRRMLDELLDGLDAVHKADYIHRDIKPANIIFRRDGGAVLLDFGAARQAIGQRSQMITSILTRGYAPVEQYLDAANATGAWSDLYSLGICAYRCLVGGDESVLVDAPSRAHFVKRGEVDKDMSPAVQVGKGKYSTSLLRAIDWAMQIEESDRPQSVTDMQSALAGEVEVENKVAATSSAIDTVKNAASMWRASRTVKVNRAHDANSSLRWVVGVIGLVVTALVAAGGVLQYQKWQDDRIAAVVRGEQQRIEAEQDARQRAEQDEEVARQVAADAERKRKIFEALEAEQTKFRRLVGRDAQARRVDGDGATDLHIAAAQNWAKLAQWLIDNGAHIRAPLKADEEKLSATLKKRLGLIGDEWSRYGQHPLHYAAHKNSIDAVKLLLDRGAGVHSKNNTGWTPLHYAADGNAVHTAKWLLAQGADVHASTYPGMTPLHFAAYENSVEVAKLLIANGADVQAQSIERITPLHSAAYGNAVNAAKFLMDEGAVINARDDYGRTPLRLAKDAGHEEMIDLLQ